MEHEHLVQGNYYHIFNRGNNGIDLFHKQTEYEHFLHLYEKYISPIADTVAWVLMPNHFHLLVYIKPNVVYKYNLAELNKMKLNKQPDSAEQKWETMNLTCQRAKHLTTLGKLESHKTPVPHRHFAHLFNAYNRYLQISTGRTGNLFERPFKRRLVDTDAYLKQLILYIHNNPVHHGFCEHPLAYPWSSFIACMSEKRTLLKHDLTIALFDNRKNFENQHHKETDRTEIEKWIEDNN